jgi:hypothetical protein
MVNEEDEIKEPAAVYGNGPATMGAPLLPDFGRSGDFDFLEL